MRNDSENLLSDLLRRWYRWQSGYSHNRGYPSRSSSCADYRVSRQYDMDDIVDARIENEQMETVEFEVSQVKEPQRTGLHVNARALALGFSVFRSPRLPDDQIAVLEIIAEGRGELTRRLLVRGVL